VEQDFPYSATSPSSSSPKQENHNLNTATTTFDSDQETMANFPVNPRPFLVAGMAVDHGWNRPARARVALGGEPTREHEDFAIVFHQPNASRSSSTPADSQSSL
jgi:hypothetical protein